PPPATWVELKTALLHRLMPSNIVEETALSLVNLRQAGNENVSSYALRLQTECTRFEQAVERITPGRSPYQALVVILFQNGLVPNIRSKVLDKKPVRALRDAIDRARRTESANLSGETPAVSAVSLTPVTSRSRLSQKFDTARQNRGRTQSFRSAPASGGGPSTTSRSTPRNGNNRGGSNSSRSTPRERPRCSHPSGKKPLGHTTETCFQRKREEAQAAKSRRENTRPMAKRSCAEDRIPREDQNNDDSDAQGCPADVAPALVGVSPTLCGKGVKRKLSTSVAVGAPAFVVPRVHVRNGSCVVPRVSARPHGTERKVLGLTALSELRVSSPVIDAEEVEPLPSSRKRLACDSSSAMSPSAPLSVSVCSHGGDVGPRKRATFAELESVSTFVPDDVRRSRQSRSRRSCLRSRVKEGNLFPVDEKIIQKMCGTAQGWRTN
ncbi:unnamed protein product, partial [Ectocarpus sp. 12 AP-2014]